MPMTLTVMVMIMTETVLFDVLSSNEHLMSLNIVVSVLTANGNMTLL